MKFILGISVFFLTIAGHNGPAIALGVLLVGLCAREVWLDMRGRK